MISEPAEKTTSITDLRVDQVARVHRLTGPAGLCQRLGEMGLTAGSPVRVVRTAPFGGPIEISVRNYHLCLRRDEGRCVLVECSEDPVTCDACELNCAAGGIVPTTERCGWLKHLGVGAFMFFAIKGLLWLLIPLGLICWRYLSN